MEIIKLPLEDFQHKNKHKTCGCCEGSSHTDIMANSNKNKKKDLNEDSLNTDDFENLLVPTKKQYFACSICDYTSKQRNNLQVHMEQHTAQKPLVTSELTHSKITRKKKFSHPMKDLGDLKRKLFKCSSCNFVNAQKGNLITHMRIHSGEKPFECKVCSRKFTQLCHLQVHNRRHTGEKPFVCTFCNCKFAQKSNLIVHTTNSHRLSV